MRKPMIAVAIIALASGAAHSQDSRELPDGSPWFNVIPDTRMDQIEQVLGAMLPLFRRFPGGQSMAGVYGTRPGFTTTAGTPKRAGAGYEYRSALVTPGGDNSPDVDTGDSWSAAALVYTPDDYWTFRGAINTSANESPLQSRLAGINTRRDSGEFTWQANDRRSAAFSYAHMKFSDTNRRAVTRMRWSERLIAGPFWNLEVTGSVYASRNSLADTPYFNPAADFSPTLEIANEWLQWRRFTHTFRHRLVLAAGNYWQQGFDSGPVAGAYYEQEWAAADRMSLRYGAGHSLHPYDGRQTTHNYAYVSFNWRF